MGPQKVNGLVHCSSQVESQSKRQMLDKRLLASSNVDYEVDVSAG